MPIFKIAFQKGLSISVVISFTCPGPSENELRILILDNVYHEILSECLTIRRNHDIFKALMKILTLIFLNPPAVKSLIIILLLILSGPKCHRNL